MSKRESSTVRHATITLAWYPLKPPFPQRPPRCFDSMTRFEEWLEAASSSIDRDGFCADCTRGMQKEMIAAGRCEFPSTDFPGVRDFYEIVAHRSDGDLSIDAVKRKERMQDKKTRRDGAAVA